jgi:hypothetical protein
VLPLFFEAVDQYSLGNQTNPEAFCFLNVRDRNSADRVFGSRPIVPGDLESLEFSIIDSSGLKLKTLSTLTSALRLKMSIMDSSGADVTQDARILDMQGAQNYGSSVAFFVGSSLTFRTLTFIAENAIVLFTMTDIKTGYYSVTFQLDIQGSISSPDNSIDPDTGEPISIDVSQYLRQYGITSCSSKSFEIFVSNINTPLQLSSLKLSNPLKDIFQDAITVYTLDAGKIDMLTNISAISLHWIAAPPYVTLQSRIESKMYSTIFREDRANLGRVFRTMTDVRAEFAEVQDHVQLTRSLKLGFDGSAGGNLTFAIRYLGVYCEPFQISVPRSITSISILRDVPSIVYVSRAFGIGDFVVKLQVVATNVSYIMVLAELRGSRNCSGAINYNLKGSLAFSSSICNADNFGVCAFPYLTLIDANTDNCEYWLEFRSPYYPDDVPLATSRRFRAADVNTSRAASGLMISASALTPGGSLSLDLAVGISIDDASAALGYSHIFQMVGFSEKRATQLQVRGGICFVDLSTSVTVMFGDCKGPKFSLSYSVANEPSSFQATMKLPALRLPSLSIGQSAVMFSSLTPIRAEAPQSVFSVPVQIVAIPDDVKISLQPVKKSLSEISLLQILRAACRVSIAGGSPLPFAQVMAFPIFLGKSSIELELPTTSDSILHLIQASSILGVSVPFDGALSASAANDILSQASPDTFAIKDLSLLLSSPKFLRAVGGGAVLEARSAYQLSNKQGVAKFNLRFLSAQDGYYCIVFLSGQHLSVPSNVFQIRNKIRSVSLQSKFIPADNQIDVTKGAATLVLKDVIVQLLGESGPVNSINLPTLLISTKPLKQTTLQSKLDAILRLVRLGLGDRGGDVLSSATLSSNKHTFKATKALQMRPGVYKFPQIQITSSTPSSITIAVQADGVQSDRTYIGAFVVPEQTDEYKFIQQLRIALFFIFAATLAVGNTASMHFLWVPASLIFSVPLFYLVWTFEYPTVTSVILYTADCISFVFLAVALYSKAASKPSLMFYHHRRQIERSHVSGLLQSFRWVALATNPSAVMTDKNSNTIPASEITPDGKDGNLAQCVLCQSSASFSCRTCSQLFCGPCMLNFHRNSMIEHVVIRGTCTPWVVEPVPVSLRMSPIKKMLSFYAKHTRELIRGVIRGEDAFFFPQRLLVSLSISIIAIARIFDGVLSFIDSIANSIPVIEAEVVSKVMMVLQLREYEFFNRMLQDLGWQQQVPFYDNIQFLHEQSRDLVFSLRLCFNLGAVVGFLWFLLTMYMILIDTRVVLLAARRQQVDLGVSRTSFLGACSFIGNQISCSIVGYGFFSFLIGFVLMPLVWTPLRVFLFNQWPFFLGFFWPKVLKTILQSTLGTKILTSVEGINYRGGFAIYDFAMSGLSLVGGFVAAVVRIVMLFVASFVSVGRIERNVFPDWLHSVVNLDGCNASYASMLRLHHMHNQPVVTMFVEQLLLISSDVKMSKPRCCRTARRMQVALLMNCYPSLRCLRKAYIAAKSNDKVSPSVAQPSIQVEQVPTPTSTFLTKRLNIQVPNSNKVAPE